MLAGKYAICVGATSGIGKGMAQKLASLQANVTVMGRSESAGRQVLDELHKLHPKGDHGLVLVDASSMKSIVTGCAEYLDKTKGKPLHFCVQSQGIATMAGRTETKEGIDQKLALHYYGRIMFIKQLTRRLQETAAAGAEDKNGGTDVRVLNIFSAGKHTAYTNLEDLDLQKNYSLQNAAMAPGFYNDLAVDQLARETALALHKGGKGGISFIHAAPGFVHTSWGKDFHWALRGPLRLLQHFGRSPEHCASIMVEHALLSAERKGQGFHLMDENGRVAKQTDKHNDFFREKVWKHTNELLDKALLLQP